MGIKDQTIAENDEIRSTLISRNITVCGRRTSVRLEPEMWLAIREIAKREACTVHDICTLIQARKNQNTSLTAAIRVFIMLYFRAATNEDGHRRAGHGNFEFMKERARVPSEYLMYFKSRKPAESPTAPARVNTGVWNSARAEARQGAA